MFTGCGFYEKSHPELVSGSLIKSAFTLAEVLITLGIIGIVAAMTLPAIIQKIDKQITVSKLKKSYATLQEIIKLSEKDNGEVSEWTFPNEEGIIDVNSNFYKKYFDPYVKTITKKTNGNDESLTYSIHNIDGDRCFYSNTWRLLSDGVAIGMFSNITYFWIFIDINGLKSPNRLGIDIFMTELKRNKRLVMLWNQKNRNILINDTNYACKKGMHAPYAGGYCGALIQYDGWQIKEDYPW